MKPAYTEELYGLYYLRVISTFMVLLAHFDGACNKIYGYRPIPFLFPFGSSIEFFLVMSGFIMIYTSTKLFETPDGGVQFLIRRLSRVVPLYWLAMSVFIPIEMHDSKSTVHSLPAYLASYLFIPYDTTGANNGLAFPILTQGWTMNYEILFYFVFAIFVPLKRRYAAIAVAGTLAALVGFGLVFNPASVALSFWTQPIVLDFGLGILLAVIFQSGVTLPVPVRLALVVSGCSLLFLDPASPWIRTVDGSTVNSMARVIGWGLPVTLIISGVIFARPHQHIPRYEIPREFALASYSMFLLHTFPIVIIGHIFQHVKWARALGPYAFIAFLFVSTFIISWLSFYYFETPVNNLLRSYFTRMMPKRSVSPR